jgi:hypothetical protein
MTSIAGPITTTEPTIAHPAWCDPQECGRDETGGRLRDVYHRTAPLTFVASGETGGEVNCDARLVQVNNMDGEGANREDDGRPYVFLEAVGAVEVAPDRLEAFGRWLLERAAEYRVATTDEHLSPTVLDEDLALTVETHNDMVILSGEPGPDGQWFFGSEEARALAAALLAHAVDADALVDDEDGR